jgi:parvulin-like peptidyl-prolyl isomerase
VAKKKTRNSKNGKKNGRNGKKAPKEESGLWPVIGAAIVLVLIIAAILLKSGQEPVYPVETTEGAAVEAFRSLGVNELVLSDLARDFASGDYTLAELEENYPGFEKEIREVNQALSGGQQTVLVTVNEEPITQSELDVQWSLLPESYKQLLTKEQVLEEMIDERILLQEAQKRGIELTDQEIEESYQQLLTVGQLTEEELLQNLYSYGLDKEDLRAMLIRQGTIDRLFEETVDLESDVTDEEAQAFYQANNDLYKTQADVTVKHILVALTEQRDDATALERITAVQERYNQGEDFCALVNEFSDDMGSKETCGEYTFPRGFMVPPFEEASFEMDIDETRIVQTQFGYHFVLKLGEQEAGMKSYEEVKQDIISNLQSQKRTQAYQAFIDELREQAEIVYPNELEQEVEEVESELLSVELVEEETEEEVEEVEEMEQALETTEEPATEVPEPTEVPETQPEEVAVEVVAGEPATPAPVDDLAACLSSKDVTLYVADWAPSSMDEAASYENLVTVVDCSAGCAEADAFPTWNVDGKEHLGSLTENELAALAGC